MLINENYLNLMQIMQIDCYLPRTQLPFAKNEPIAQIAKPKLENVELPKSKSILKQLPKPTINQAQKSTEKPQQQASTEAQITNKKQDIPQFNLQLLRAQNCFILADLPNRAPLSTHMDLHLLLQAMLRAANLTSNYQIIGPVLFWPLFKSNVIIQDVSAATEYIHEVITGHTTNNYACLWLMGENAAKFAGDLANVWILPSLQNLMANRDDKRKVWEQMKQQLTKWSN